MINLFNLARASLNAAPAQKEKLANSALVKRAETVAAPVLNPAKKVWGKIAESNLNKMKSNLFSDERDAYEKMKADGISDREAFGLIKQRRQAIADQYGGLTELSTKEGEAIVKMRQDGIPSTEAFDLLQQYRGGFENREMQLAQEYQNKRQENWDKTYNEMPAWKKGLYHTTMFGVGASEGVLGTVINTQDWLMGGTEQGREWRDTMDNINADPMFNNISRGAGKVVGEAGTMIGAAAAGGGAIASTKVGAALGAGALMTPATTVTGMATQGALAGAGYGAWSTIAQQGADTKGEDIRNSALLGGAVGGVATPVMSKIVAPAVGKTIGETAKIGNAGKQAFQHTAGTLDDRVAAAIHAIRKSTGRTTNHAVSGAKNAVSAGVSNVKQGAVNAKEAFVRKFLAGSDDAANGAAKVGKIQNIKNNMAGLTDADLEILRKTTTQEFDDLMQQAKKAVGSTYENTPYYKGAQKANEVMDILEENIRKNQIQRMDIIKQSNIKNIPFDKTRVDVMDDLAKTFNVKDWKQGKNGIELIPVDGRKILLDPTNTRDLRALQIIDDAMRGGNPAEVMDTVRILQGYAYDSSTGLRVSKDMAKFLERTTGKINSQFKATMGDDYARILAEMSDDIKLQQEMKRIFKPGIGEEASNRGELAMKRIANGTTTSGEARNLALKIQDRTGVDLIKTSRLAQLSMDIAGDDRGLTLFGAIKDTSDKGLLRGLTDITKKAVANPEVVARQNTIHVRNIFGLTDDTSIKGLDKAISSIKFSQKDMAQLSQISTKISKQSPLTRLDKNNIATVQKLVAERIPAKELELFQSRLTHYGVGKGVSSKYNGKPITNLLNGAGSSNTTTGGTKLLHASKRFNENFRKLSDRQFKKLQTALDENTTYNIRFTPSEKVRKLLSDSGYEGKVKSQIITSDGIRHILKRHGPESNDKNPITMSDIEIIPEIQTNPDKIRISNKTSRKGEIVIIYEKEINGQIYYLEGLDEYGNLKTQTMYKK